MGVTEHGGGHEEPLRPAPWETRVWASWVDLMVAVLVIAPFVGYAQVTAVPREYGDAVDLTPSGIAAAWAGILIALAVWSWNRYVRQARTGRSIGKRRQGLRVLDAEGRTPTAGRLLVRDLAHVLDVLPACLGLLWPIWDRRRQTFADKIVGTVVVPATASAG